MGIEEKLTTASKIKSLLNIREQEKVLDALIRSSFINILARGFGYLKHVTIAVVLGFNLQTDAFFMALSLIGIFLIFADVFDSIGVPNLVDARLKSQEEFKKLSGLLFTFTLILTFLTGFLAIGFYPFVLKIPVGFNMEALSYTQVAYFLLLPYLLFNFLFHHFGAVLRSVRRFTVYFVGEFLFSFFSFLFIFLGLIFYNKWLVLPLSISFAQIIATLYMFYVGREFIHINFFLNQTTKKILNHFFYLSALYGVLHLFIVIDRAFGSLLGEKSISAIHYGLIVASIPRGIIRLENIAITSLSESKGDIKKLNFYIKRILIVSGISLLFFFVFAEIIVKLLFGYGAFTQMDLILTVEATRFYSLSLPFMFLWPILYRVFQIKENLKPVFFIAISGITVNGILNYFFVLKLNYGIKGIALGTLGAYIVICSLSYIILYYKYRRN
ncbi:lipid II flippase MurJ [Aquifex aeolicus]|uniref:Virulence factor MviN n=1 Tax=Aquifex aeolicus (strain VF5) TaxID=224324 RepID=O66797_AQUAE|nr:murein biosynthesis integral membrane protein MurJ [Aquifex aeolicus]AAC06762.1 hypothetical protein aq_509 [Aquifex aeolicus VF5]